MTVVKVVWRAGELACSLGNWLLSQAALHSDDEPLSPAAQDAGEQLLGDLHRGHDKPKPWCSRCQAHKLWTDSQRLRLLEEQANEATRQNIELRKERDELMVRHDRLIEESEARHRELLSRGAAQRGLDQHRYHIRPRAWCRQCQGNGAAE